MTQRVSTSSATAVSGLFKEAPSSTYRNTITYEMAGYFLTCQMHIATDNTIEAQFLREI